MKTKSNTWPDGTPRSQRNAFDWCNHAPQINLATGAKYDKTRVRVAKDLVAGEAHEPRNAPAKNDALSVGYHPLGIRRVDVGRLKMKAGA